MQWCWSRQYIEQSYRVEPCVTDTVSARNRGVGLRSVEQSSRVWRAVGITARLSVEDIAIY